MRLFKKEKTVEVAGSGRLCVCVFTREWAVFWMNGEASLDDFQISWNRRKGHSWTTWHTSIKALLKWSSLPRTDTVNQRRLVLSYPTAWTFKAFKKNFFLQKKYFAPREEFILSFSALNSTPAWPRFRDGMIDHIFGNKHAFKLGFCSLH